MIFSFNLLQSFFYEKLPPPDELAKILALRLFETERGEEVGRDTPLKVDVLPNRPDCLSHLGLAREISVILKLKMKSIRFLTFKEGKKQKGIGPEVRIRNKKGCKRYMGRTILNIDVFPSPSWLKEAIITCGFSPINNVVDITNYVSIYLGQPLHAFDLDKIEGEIVIRKAKEREKFLSLDEKEYLLDPGILVIADKKGPLAIAGVKGGKRAEISQNTRNIFIEAANFDPSLVKRAAKKLNLETHSSFLFSQGIDPNLAEDGLNLCLSLISEISGGDIQRKKIDFYFEKSMPKKIFLPIDDVERLSGTKIMEAEIKSILRSLGFKTKKEDKETLSVLVPTFRQDISLKGDLIEEVVRIYGLEKIPSLLPKETLILPKRNEEIFWQERAKDILKESGFFEVRNYSFLSGEEKKFFSFPHLIEVENPVSRDFKFLRASLLPSLLRNVRRNEKFFKDLKLFELGKVFILGKKKEKIERRNLAGILTGKEKFFELKGAISLLFEGFGISGLWFDFFKATPEGIKNIWDLKRAAEIKIGDKEIGFLGRIREDILKNLKIESEVFAFEIDFEELQSLAAEESEFEEIPKYPAAVRDLSLWVPIDVLSDEVMAKIFDVEPDFLKDVDLFDIYENEGEGRKSLAFHLIFQSNEKTLLPEDLNLAMEKIHQALEKNFGWEIRR